MGDYVRICGHIGKIVFSCGAFGIFIADEVPWDALEELVRKDSGNRASFLYNDTFISFWEIVWNLSEDTDEPCLPYVESITATGGIFTDENGNKDVFMGCINGCSATLTQCEYTCGRYYTCDTITNVCKSMMDAVKPYKVVTLVMDYIDDKKMGEHLEVDCPSHLIRDADVLRRKGISVTRISAFAKPEATQRFVYKHPNLIKQVEKGTNMFDVFVFPIDCITRIRAGEKVLWTNPTT